MGLSSKRILGVAIAAALAMPAAPAYAAERCGEGGNWRSAGADAGSQTFRLEARDRSSAGAQGQYGVLEDDWTYHDLGRSYERITKVEYRRGKLTSSAESHKDIFTFVSTDGEILASCAYEYKVRNKTTTIDGKSKTAAQIKYVDGKCTAAPDYKVSCTRDYSPDNRRLKVSITLQDD
ncbi:MAG: hypothetical protein AAFY01_10545 [Pseudomonadota bacterium]